jgi:hypothetical protein
MLPGFNAEEPFIAGVKIMQTTSDDSKFNTVLLVKAVVTKGVSRSATAASVHAYQPSQPQVLTDALKAQLAAANQQRRENLYPRLVQTLAVIEQGAPTHHQSQERVMSLEELSAANRARRNRLRETGYALPQSSVA